MESSQVDGVGADEKCSGSSTSTESGWTMYIGSPIDGERGEDYSSSDGIIKGREASLEHVVVYEDVEESDDDSMASDASSGPCHKETGEKSCGVSRLRRATTRQNVKKPCTKKKEKRDEMTDGKKDEEEILLHKAVSAASHI